MTEYARQTVELSERLRAGNSKMTVNELKEVLSGPPVSLSIHVPEESAVRHILATANLNYIPAAESNTYVPSTDTKRVHVFDIHLKEWLLVTPSKVLSIYLKPVGTLEQLLIMKY